MQLFPPLTGARRVVLYVGFLVLGGMFLLQKVTLQAITPSGPPLFTYRSTRGPYHGRFDRASNAWQLASSEDQYSGVFHPGQSVLWETDIDIPASLTVSVQFDLICDGKPYGGADHRYGPDHPRPSGIMPLGMQLPVDLPSGACRIDRTDTFRAAGGRVETASFPPIRFTVMAAP